MTRWWQRGTDPPPWEMADAQLVITIDEAGVAAVWSRLDEATAVAVLAAVLHHATEHGGLPTPQRRVVIRRPPNYN